MEYQSPSFVELNMSAEIGAYQEDFGGGGNEPPATADLPAPAADPLAGS